MAGQIEKETNNSPQSSQRALRKKITSAFSAVSAVRYFLKMASDFMKFHTSAASGLKKWPVKSKKKL
jgi:hypothetical protein